MVYALVLPAVAEVTFVGEDAHDSTFVNQGEELGRFAIVLVNLRQAVRESIRLLEYLMRIGQFHKIQLGKHLLHLRLNVLPNAIVVVDVEETTRQHVVAQILCLSCIKDHVAMTRHIDVWIVEQVGTRRLHSGHIRVDVSANLLVTETHQVGQRCRVAIPVSAPTVFQQGDIELLGRGNERK